MSFTPLLASLIATLAFSDATVASSFLPNCTLPPNHTSFVWRPSVRSTLSILWDCLSIIFLCSWSVLHLNFPASRRPTASIVQKIWWAIWDSRKKVKWMILSILMPELLVGKALNELIGASATPHSGALAHLAEVDGTEWGMTHAYFANMGGFILDFTEVLDQQLSGLSPDHASALDRLADEVESCAPPRCYYEKINLLRMRHKRWALTADQINYARVKGLIQTLPQISQNSLEKLNRGDAVVKTLALIQVSWLMIQLIVRFNARIAISQLEVAVFAYSVVSLLTYLLYWMRPQGVETTFSMEASRLPQTDEMKELATIGCTYLWSGKRGERSKEGDYEFVPIPNDSCVIFKAPTRLHLSVGDQSVLSLALGAILGGTVFGGVHFIAWNFHFPRPAEAFLWRTSSILTTALPIVSIPLTYFWSERNWSTKTGRTKYLRLDLVFSLCVVMYVLARLFIIIETFRTLGFLPPDAFIDTWSSNVPHWG